MLCLGLQVLRLARTSHRSDIDGLRAVAVSLVVLFHAGIDRLFARYHVSLFGGGYVGVDVFYVISGYLITSSLIRELKASGSVSYVLFVGRRVRRLLPAANLVVMFVAGASFLLLPPIDRATLVADGFASVLYVANVVFALRSVDYFAEGVEQSPLLHYWSLSVEEQFYFLWPIFLVWVWRRARDKSPVSGTFAAIGLVLACSLFLSAMLTATSPQWAYFGLPTRAWELAAGGLAGAVAPSIVRRWLWVARIAGWLGLLMIILSAMIFDERTPFPGLAAIVPVVGTMGVIVAGVGGVSPRSVGALLGSRVLQYVGRVSYSWYLWHWPFLVLAGPAVGAFGRPDATTIAAAVVLSFVAAALTYHFVELPTHRSSRLASGWGTATVLLATSVPVLVMLMVIGHQPDVSSSRADDPAFARRDRVRLVDGCAQEYFGTEATPCFFGDGGSRMDFVVIGDSHAQHLVPALDLFVRQIGARGVLFSKAACAPFDARQWMVSMRREYRECAVWRERVMRDVADRDVVAVMFARFGNYGHVLLDQDGRRSGPGDVGRVWREAVERTLRQLGGIGAPVVIARDVPNAGFDVPSCLSSERTAESCALPEGAARWDGELHDGEVEAVTAVGSGVDFFDPTDDICDRFPCPVVSGDGVIKYRDGNHLTETYARSLGSSFGRRLGALLGGVVRPEGADESPERPRADE